MGSQNKSKGSKNNMGKKQGSTARRGQATITGHGDYTISTKAANRLRTAASLGERLLAALPKGAFSAAGGALGGMLGPQGGMVGAALGHGLSSITGYGDYVVSSNTLSTTGSAVDTVPQFVRKGADVRVMHREFLGDIKVPAIPTEFSNLTYRISAGETNTFPWLSSIARQFQEYEIHGMVFEFKTMSSDYAASGPLGTVCLATNYNANDLPYTSKIQMENSDFAVSTKPSYSIIHAIECAQADRPTKCLYVRDSNTVGDVAEDARLYDLGIFQLATVGLPGTVGSVLGELWVSYDISLKKPIISVSAALLPNERVQVANTSSMANAVHVATGFSGETNGLIQTNATGVLPSAVVKWVSTVPSDRNTFQILKAGTFSIAGKMQANGTITPDSITAMVFTSPAVKNCGATWANSNNYSAFSQQVVVPIEAIGSEFTVDFGTVGVSAIQSIYLDVAVIR